MSNKKRQLPNELVHELVQFIPPQKLPIFNSYKLGSTAFGHFIGVRYEKYKASREKMIEHRYNERSKLKKEMLEKQAEMQAEFREKQAEFQAEMLEKQAEMQAEFREKVAKEAEETRADAEEYGCTPQDIDVLVDQKMAATLSHTISQASSSTVGSSEIKTGGRVNTFLVENFVDGASASIGQQNVAEDKKVPESGK